MKKRSSTNPLTNRDIVLLFLARLAKARGDGVFSICDLEARVPDFARRNYAHGVACGTVRRAVFAMIADGTLGRIESWTPKGKRHKVYRHELGALDLVSRIGGSLE